MLILYGLLTSVGVLILIALIVTLRLIFYPGDIKKKTGIGSIFDLDITTINIKSADNVRLLSPDQIDKIQQGDY
jgi:hypothetical protein